MQILIQIADFVLGVDHKNEEESCFNHVPQAHGLFPDQDGKLVRQRLLIRVLSWLVEALAELAVLAVLKLVHEGQIVRSRQVED